MNANSSQSQVVHLEYKPPLPTGEYECEITSVESIDGKFGPQVCVHLEACAPHVGYEVTGWASAKFAPGAKLFRWWSAATAGVIDPELGFSSEDMVGKNVVAVIVQKSGDKGPVMRVEDLKPAKSKAKKA